MSYNQIWVAKGEGQLRRSGQNIGVSVGSGGKNDSVGGAGHPPSLSSSNQASLQSNRSFKKSGNGQVSQPRINLANLGFETSVATVTPRAVQNDARGQPSSQGSLLASIPSGPKPGETTMSRPSLALPKAPLPQSSSGISESPAPSTPVKGDGTKRFARQLRTMSPGIVQPQGITPSPASVVSAQSSVPETSLLVIHSVDSGYVTSDSKRRESIKRLDSLKDNEEKSSKKDPRASQQHQQADEPTVRISKNSSSKDGNSQSTKEYSISTETRIGEAVENKAIPAVPDSSEVSMKEVAPQYVIKSCSNSPEVSTTGRIAAKEKGLLKASSSSGPEMNENSSKDLDPTVRRTDIASWEVGCRKMISEESKHGKFETSEVSIIDSSNAKVLPVPTITESSKVAKPTMVVKQEGSPTNGSDVQAPTSLEPTNSSCNDKDIPSSPYAIKNEPETTCSHDVASTFSGLSHPEKVAVETPVISEGINKSEAYVMEVDKDGLTASGTSGPQDKVPFESVKAKHVIAKREKLREILSKTDAVGTSDVYNANNGREEKLQHANQSESVDSSLVVDDKMVNLGNHDKDVATVREAGQTALRVMHKAEKKYEVGKVSNEEQAKQKQLKGILNKLTPQNFEKLFQQVCDVNIGNATTLCGVIVQIFDIALMEPIFCEMYANFCFHLSGIVPDFTENNERITFKRLLLNKCQEEFERGEREQADADRAEAEDGIKQSDEEREEKRIKAQRRMLGNILLIGELYKKKLFPERIMHGCIQKLLGQLENPGEQDLETLCKLMSTIGDQIDHAKAKVHMDGYFNGMMKLSANQKLSSRVRFMLRDLIDLRKNRWQQRWKVLCVINSDADRWCSLYNSRCLMPPPQTPLQVMDNAEKKYKVGIVSDEEQSKQRQFKGILNKLTPQNFEKLFQQFIDVNIGNITTLSGVVAQIFDKALMEPTFCEMYANFCFHLSGVLPDFTENNENITFKRLLLNKCQEEFERGEREQAEADRVEEEDGIKQSDEEREEREIKTRRRMLGNIQLIGELYKKKMLAERIMHECIQKLLGQHENPGEDDLEALCKLMSTVGDQIDHAKAKVRMDAYFDGMMKLSTNQKLSSRVRFMLRDVIDSRKNRWQQRRKATKKREGDEVCACGLPARIYTSRIANNPDQRFWRCRNWMDEDLDCHHFIWIKDEDKVAAADDAGQAAKVNQVALKLIDIIEELKQENKTLCVKNKALKESRLRAFPPAMVALGLVIKLMLCSFAIGIFLGFLFGKIIFDA